MKKTYINPEMMIIPLKAGNSLLAGSVTENTEAGTYSVGFFEGERNASTDEDI